MVSMPKLRGYVFLIEMSRITIEEVPEPYKTEIINQYPQYALIEEPEPETEEE